MKSSKSFNLKISETLQVLLQDFQTDRSIFNSYIGWDSGELLFSDFQVGSIYNFGDRKSIPQGKSWVKLFVLITSFKAPAHVRTLDDGESRMGQPDQAQCYEQISRDEIHSNKSTNKIY